MNVGLESSSVLKKEILSRNISEEMEVEFLGDDFFKAGLTRYLVMEKEEAVKRARMNVIRDIFMIRSEYINKYLPKHLLALDWVEKVQNLDMDYNQINTILAGSLLDKEGFIDEMISIDGLDYYIWENHTNVYTDTHLGQEYRILELQ